MITAKVKIQGKTPIDGDQTIVTFSPDYEDGANKEWAKYTPALSLSMTVLDEVAQKFGPIGTKFTLSFEQQDDKS